VAAWLARYDVHAIQGDIPQVWEGQATADSLSRWWLRDDPPRPLDFAGLTAMADVFFPRVWLRRATRVPVGTVSMTVYFHADAHALQAVGGDFVLAQARAQEYRGGFFDQTAQLWARDGTMLATTHQLVYYKS
jgi:acyl-CoA thioesterase